MFFQAIANALRVKFSRGVSVRSSVEAQLADKIAKAQALVDEQLADEKKAAGEKIIKLGNEYFDKQQAALNDFLDRRQKIAESAIRNFLN